MAQTIDDAVLRTTEAGASPPGTEAAGGGLQVDNAKVALVVYLKIGERGMAENPFSQEVVVPRGLGQAVARHADLGGEIDVSIGH